jgi:hypothetical protein
MSALHATGFDRVEERRHSCRPFGHFDTSEADKNVRAPCAISPAQKKVRAQACVRLFNKRAPL